MDRASTKNGPQRAVVVSSVDSGDCITEFRMGISQFLAEKRNYTIANLMPDDIDNWPPDFHPAIRVDGIIAHVALRERAQKLKAFGVPIVDLSGEMTDDPAFIPVDCDNSAAARMAAERFLQRGFTSFAYYGVSSRQSSDILKSAFASTVDKAGHRCQSLLVDASEGFATPTLKNWISKLPRHTALLCMNDYRAHAALRCCQATGRSVPDDIAVMGMNNNKSYCLCATVPLSSVDTNLRGLGYAAMRILSSAIENPVKPKLRRTYLVPPGTIFERESTAVYPVEPPWLADVLAHLDRNIDRPLAATDLAEAAGVAHSTLQAAFHKTFGTTAGKYILSVKMREAKRLVEEGRFSIKEIAAKTGFSSMNYFSRSYRNYYGRSPTKARAAGA